MSGASNRAMVSNVDTSQPPYGNPTTALTRRNFEAIKEETEQLQTEVEGKLDLAGGDMSGPIGLIDGQVIDGGQF
jgi:hypothetical protein